MLPCERIFALKKLPIFSTSPPRGDAKKCYHVNVYLKNRQFSQHRPQEVMPKQCYNVNVFPFLKIKLFLDIAPKR